MYWNLCDVIFHFFYSDEELFEICVDMGKNEPIMHQMNTIENTTASFSDVQSLSENVPKSLIQNRFDE